MMEEILLKNKEVIKRLETAFINQDWPKLFDLLTVEYKVLYLSCKSCNYAKQRVALKAKSILKKWEKQQSTK